MPLYGWIESTSNFAPRAFMTPMKAIGPMPLALQLAVQGAADDLV